MEIDFSQLTESERAEYTSESEQLPGEDVSEWRERNMANNAKWAKVAAERAQAATDAGEGETA